MLTASVKWQERHASYAINRKLAGILAPGVYQGFELAAEGMAVRVHHGDETVSTAVIEREGYSLTLRLDADEVLTVPGPGRWFAVVEAYYTPGQETQQRLKLTANPEPHHVILGSVDVPDGAVQVETNSISYDERMIGNPAMGIMQLVSINIGLTQTTIDLGARLANVEAWAGLQGYDKNKLYKKRKESICQH